MWRLIDEVRAYPVAAAVTALLVMLFGIVVYSKLHSTPPPAFRSGPTGRNRR